MWIDSDIIAHSGSQKYQKIWVPDKNYVVLGSSNKEETEVYREQCQADEVEILRRCGGGGTVLLHRRCVIVSLGIWVKRLYQNDLYFKKINDGILNVLKEMTPNRDSFNQKGFSDLVFKDRKFGGTSMFRSKRYLLYQASLLVDKDLALIEKYLQHPTKEPEYRKSRSHGDFLIGLNEIVPDLSTRQLVEVLQSNLEVSIESQLSEEIGEVDQKHLMHLKKRIS